MNKLAFLEYAFIFDPDSTWTNMYDFENKLAEFFKVHGFEAQIVDTVKGHVGRRVIFIVKIKDLLDDPSRSFREAAKKEDKKAENPLIAEVKKEDTK